MNQRQAQQGDVVAVAGDRQGCEIKSLVAQYGGRASKWVKKSSPQFEIAGERFEYHWYEHPEIGRLEVKEIRLK